MNTLLSASKFHRSALFLEQLLSRRSQQVLRYLFGSVSTALVVLYWTTGLTDIPFVNPVAIFGLFLIFVTVWATLILLYSFHNYHYFYGLNSIIGTDDDPVHGVTYEVADVIRSHPDDVTKAFVTSAIGELVLRRIGVTQAEQQTYLTQQRPRFDASAVSVPERKLYTLMTLGQQLLSQDKSFAALLKDRGITSDTFFGALSWVMNSYLGRKRSARWWSKDNLSHIRGIGRELSYGRAYILDRFARDIRTSAVFSTFTSNNAYAEKKVAEIESALARQKAANVLVVGEAGVGKMDLVIAVANRMSNGTALEAVAGKHIIVLDTDRVFALHNTKQELEVAFLKIFSEARRAGNIVIVIERLGQVIKEAETQGVFLPQLLDEFLAAPELNIIATDTPGAFHSTLQNKGALLRRFAEVLVEPADMSGTISLLEGLAENNESTHRTLFTYQAILAIAKSAEQYIVEGVMPDKAVGLLLEIAAKAGQTQQSLVTADFVYTHISEKTGIPVGPIQDSERDMLLHLEDKLHELVIGQDKALEAIAKTMRRARVGIQQADKPIGTFLFLGPTGVGKTETAKALATIFFGGADKMQRVDMSEFSGPDALPRLIGDGENAGVLPSVLTEHPYSVLLLDEFEKAAQGVHDLFLQILDEGVFTDARGQKINARNTIIIATSNAGSQLIIKTVTQRQALATLHDEIIAHIIQTGLFRPELINRFDSTIIFEPLTKEEQGGVAQLMLGDLYERIKERGYDLTLSRDLIDVLVEKGYDPEFGARPMQRVLQDTIEEKIAQKIISGEVKPGDTIALKKDDFLEVELSTN